MNSTSESLLLRLKDAGDQYAWSRFVRLYTPLLFHWARDIGLQSQDAADLVQEVLTLVFRKLPDFQYDRSKSFRSWLRTVTINKFREFHRRRRITTEPATQSELNQAALVQDAGASWDLSYQFSLFESALQLLEPEFRPKTWQAVRAFVIENRPAAEIAAETGVSVWTIYAAKSRLIVRLREELKGLLE